MQDHDTVRRRKTLDPKLDMVFQMLFGAEQNRELLISLLNAVLNPKVAIESITVLSGQPERLAVGDKNISLDLRLPSERRTSRCGDAEPAAPGAPRAGA